MASDQKIFVDARMVLNAVISGADVEKVKRHWPQYTIEIEDGKRLSIALTDAELKRIESAKAVELEMEQARIAQHEEDLRIAREAAKAAEAAEELTPPAAPEASTLLPVT